MAHTPRPWKSITEGAEIYIKGERYWICEIISIDNEEELDNARLIAAAPEMLEVCKLLAALEADDGGRRFPTKEEIQAARNVVVKASQ